jgi:hypothetical protein
LVALQLVAGAVLPSADALLEAERVGLPTHVESPHNEDCPAAHDHLFCQVVRSLASASASPAVGSLPDATPPILAAEAIAERDDSTRRPSLRGPTTPRPPPLG